MHSDLLLTYALWIVISDLLIAISDPLIAISDLYIAILGAMIHLFSLSMT